MTKVGHLLPSDSGAEISRTEKSGSLKTPLARRRLADPVEVIWTSSILVVEPALTAPWSSALFRKSVNPSCISLGHLIISFCRSGRKSTLK